MERTAETMKVHDRVRILVDLPQFSIKAGEEGQLVALRSESRKYRCLVRRDCDPADVSWSFKESELVPVGEVA
jgi:hypothetical protein